MTISNEVISAGPYEGNGATTSFSFAFKLFATSELKVVKATSAGVESTLVLDTDYSVTLNEDQDNNPGGSITYPISGDALPAGETLTLTSDVSNTQGTTLPNGGAWNAKTVERMIDKCVILIKQLLRDVGRALKQPISDSVALDDLPTAANRRGKFLAFTDDTEAQPTAVDGSDGTSGSLALALAASSGSSLIGHIASGISPSTQTAQEKMRKVIHASDYDGYDSTGTNDSATAITNAYNAAVAAGIKTVHVNGTPKVNSAIAITNNIKFVGDGKFTTRIDRNFSGSSNDDGIFKVTGGADLEVEGMTLRSSAGTTGGCLISAVADASNAPSLTLRAVDMTTADTDTHAYTLYLDGSLKTTGSIGIRDCAFHNVDVFGASTKAVLLKSVVNFSWFGGGVFSAGGSSGSIQLSGNASVSSTNVNLALASIAAMDLDYTDNTIIKTGNIGAVTNTSNVTDTMIFAPNASGTVQTNWLRSWLVASDGIRFPATQNASTDANTLDDYEEGTWTPVLTFGTPGDLAVTHSIQVGTYTKVGNRVTASFAVVTSAFTHTTASGNLTISGLPFASNSTSHYRNYGAGVWQGITKASYTNINAEVFNNTANITFIASGSGQTQVNVAAADCPSGGTMHLRFTVTYQAAT